VQNWIGPSWTNGNLFFVKTCLSCNGEEATYRYDPESASYAYASNRIRISGFAMDHDGRRAFQALGFPGDRAALAGEHKTALRLTDPLTRVRPPIIRPG
jgi:hypothetical protein